MCECGGLGYILGRERERVVVMRGSTDTPAACDFLVLLMWCVSSFSYAELFVRL